ncbi:hypothetical protein K438DRAFT_1986520 [Mycena galopus ATCC 62051]|nr:hypothetical protein K438DRAFT_1986520 [Mycena galopus ATCC 62051]
MTDPSIPDSAMLQSGAQTPILPPPHCPLPTARWRRNAGHDRRRPPHLVLPSIYVTRPSKKYSPQIKSTLTALRDRQSRHSVWVFVGTCAYGSRCCCAAVRNAGTASPLAPGPLAYRSYRSTRAAFSFPKFCKDTVKARATPFSTPLCRNGK